MIYLNFGKGGGSKGFRESGVGNAQAVLFAGDLEVFAMKELRKGPKRILVAEKDEEVRHLLSESLRLGGYSVIEIDRPSGINTIGKTEIPDLFLLGHGTSEDEAFSAIDIVRKSASFESVPIILMAVDPDENFLMKAISRGADGLLPFPFSMEALHEKVGAILSGIRTPMVLDH